MNTRMMNAEFPVTGQPIRVVVIDGEPWFATMDVCKILGHNRNTTEATRSLHKSETRRVNTRGIKFSPTGVSHVSAGGNGYQRGNPMLNVVSESGLYRLIMRSDKPAARPFQDWVSRELLPSIRRGDADLGAQRERMAETFAEALDLDRPAASPLMVDDQGFEIRTDGSVHCEHGMMAPVLPDPIEEAGPPFGVYYVCRSVEHVGIRGSIAYRPCRRLHFVDIVRQLLRQRTAEPAVAPAAPPHLVTLAGPPAYVAEVLQLMGVRSAS
ncbi:BRO-N domain-containing protein [Streptacidiphilus rugosus]|uniref:BRO-N domain-containing protein n=1 Tax=Streptacidiphilus rugosus TaxID=405783 RepID=UPI0012FCFFA0|nr:Bro-N domain-containing protein [Streptacidiphilus rugosus]